MRLVKTVRRSAGGIDALVPTVIAEPRSPGPRQAEAAGRRVYGYEHGARQVGESMTGVPASTTAALTPNWSSRPQNQLGFIGIGDVDRSWTLRLQVLATSQATICGCSIRNYLKRQMNWWDGEFGMG